MGSTFFLVWCATLGFNNVAALFGNGVAPTGPQTTDSSQEYTAWTSSTPFVEQRNDEWRYVEDVVESAPSYSQINPAPDPWTGDRGGRWQAWPESPRRRQPSPRKRGKGKGTPAPGKDKGKDKSKGKGEGHGGSQPPSLSSLPKPPQATEVGLPPDVSSSSRSNMDPGLQSLLGALAQTREDLPPHIRELVDTQMQADHKAFSKSLHKAVSAQGAARRELAQLRSARRDYTQAWLSYTEGLCSTWTKQIEEKNRVMNDFTEKEEKWEAQLADCSKTIAQLASEADGAGREGVPSDVIDVEEQEAMVDAAAQQDVQRQMMIERMAAQENQITQALKEAATSAKEQMVVFDKERERSPRRGVKAPAEGAKQGGVGDQPPPHKADVARIGICTLDLDPRSADLEQEFDEVCVATCDKVYARQVHPVAPQILTEQSCVLTRTQSQPVQPLVVCTALSKPPHLRRFCSPIQHMPVDRLHVKPPSDIQRIVAEALPLVSGDVQGPLLHKPVKELVCVGSAPDGDDGVSRFTVFDTIFHERTRARGVTWSTMDCLADAVASAATRTKAAQLITIPMHALPRPQITLSPAGVGRTTFALPLDLRDYGFSVYTFEATPGNTVQDVFDQLATARVGRRPLLTTGLNPGTLQFMDAKGHSTPHLLEPVTDHEWLRLVPLHIAELVPSTTTTCTYMHTFAPSLLGDYGMSTEVTLPSALATATLWPRTIGTPIGANIPITRLNIYPGLGEGEGRQVSFTLFVHGYPPIRLQGAKTWSMLDFCRDAAMQLEATPISVQLVTNPILGLAVPQITITETGLPREGIVLPLDMRDVRLDVMPVAVRPGATMATILGQAEEHTPELTAVLAEHRERGQVFLQDSHGHVLDVVPDHPQALQWIAVRVGPHPFPTVPMTTGHQFLDGHSVSTTSTSTTTTVSAPWSGTASDHDQSQDGHASNADVVYECEDPLPVLAPTAPAEPPALLTKGCRAVLPKADVHAGVPCGPELLPVYLDNTRFQLGPACTFSWGFDEAAPNNAMFTVFDVERHWTIQRRDRADSLPSIVQAAVRAAPFGVRSVQILTVPLPNLPRPQLVLSRDRDPVNLVPIPWDVRAIGGEIRTINHLPGENILVFTDKVQQTQLALPHMRAEILSAQLVVLDALGFVGDFLPRDLEQVQHFRIEGSAASFFTPAASASRGSGAFDTFAYALTSTSTTTPASAVATYRLTLLWGTYVVHEDIQPPCHQLDALLRRLLLELFARSARGSPVHDLYLALAKEQPPSNDGVQDILIIVTGPGHATCPIVVVDEREHNQDLHAPTLSYQAACSALVHPQWRGAGVSLLINAAPEALAQRPAYTGDYLQFMNGTSRPASFPTAALLDLFPALVPYAWPLHIGESNKDYGDMRKARLRRCKDWPGWMKAAMEFPLPDGIEQCALEPFAREQLTQALPCDIVLVPAARRLLDNLPILPPLDQPDALMVFVDGSFRAGRSAWAVVVLGRRHGLWHWLGFRCGRVPPPLAGNSVYEAEIWAQIVALGIVSAADLPALILYDSQSAALTAIGATAGLSSCPLQSTLTSLTSYARQSSHPPQFRHEYGDDALSAGLAPDVQACNFKWLWLRLLIVLAHTNLCRVAFVVAHAPTSAAPAAEREQWWAHLTQRLASLPPGATPIMLCDANARFVLTNGEEYPENENAQALHHIASRFDLCRTQAYNPTGDLIVTWRSPQGRPACLDYILVPRLWHAGMQTVTNLGLLDEHAGVDHEVLGARLQLCFQPSSAISKGLDREAMLSPAGRQAIAQLFASAPVRPWAAGADEHLQELHAHLLNGARALFPRQSGAPRRPVISPHTWHLLHLKRWARRVHRRRQLLHRREHLYSVFRGWCNVVRGSNTNAISDNGKQRDLQMAHYLRFMQVLGGSLKAATQTDEAAFAREHLARARAQGPRAMAAAIRAVLRHGRRYKPPAPAPVLEMSSGETIHDAATVKEAFGRHFAVSEKASSCAFSDLAGGRPEVPARIVVEALPSLAELSSAFSSMKCGKSAGPTLLPAELFKAAPLEAALSTMPIVLKAQARQCFPLLWRGVHSIALLKPNKPPLQVDSHRAIALMACTGKAVAKACRPTLANCFETITLGSVGGSRKQVPIELPSLMVQAYLSHLRHAKLNGAVLFLDGVAAFPSTDRTLLFDLTDEQLDAKLAETQVEPEVAIRYRASFRQHGAFSRAQVPPDLVQFLAASLKRTWFSTDECSQTAYATTRGTLPGAPNADLGFQFAVQASLEALYGHLADEGITAHVALRQGEHLAAPPATWLDDVALLVSSSDATTLPAQVSRAASLAAQYFNILGVKTNFSTGKTEAIMHLCGKGKQETQRQCLLGTDHGTCISVLLEHPTLRRYRKAMIQGRQDLTAPAAAKARLFDRAAAMGVQCIDLPAIRVSDIPSSTTCAAVYAGADLEPEDAVCANEDVRAPPTKLV
ncbi:unnamed protein product, partial [Symbiodinium sp. KB8]